MEQLLLDLDREPVAMAEEEIDEQRSLRHVDLQRAVVAWMARNKAIGVGLKVPTRIRRFRADVAAFWNRARRNPKWEGPSNLLVPCRTLIVECRRDRGECWPDCANSAELLPKLRVLKAERRDLEADIRREEPELRETATLFDEYSDWNYESSQNARYQQVRRDIDKVEHALYHGTRFEAIRSACMADFLYLAVPEKTVHPREIAEGWGLLWIDADLNVRVVAPAEERQSPPENRFHLVQNIASSALAQISFTLGIQERDGETQFLKVPRRRRPRSGA